MIENRHIDETKTTFPRGARINTFVEMVANPLHHARALAVTAEYALVLAAIWLSIANWIMHRPTGGDPNTANELAQTAARIRAMLVYPNVLGFGVCAFWFSRERTFAPLARYLVPSVFAALLTLPLVLIAFYLLQWGLYLHWPPPRPVGLVLLLLPGGVPGLLTGQMLRWPKVQRVERDRAEGQLVNDLAEEPVR